MIKHVKNPAVIQAHGNKPKRIEEFIGRVNTATRNVSIARMKSPAGWREPGQIPRFDEYTLVLKGILRVRTRTRTLEVRAGEAIGVGRGEWVQYATPAATGAEYVAVCLPAFSPKTVNRDEERHPGPSRRTSKTPKATRKGAC